MRLYLTADQVGIETGGGLVTHHESEALKSLGPCEVVGRERLTNHPSGDPWCWDLHALARVRDWEQASVQGWMKWFSVVHCYAGTFSRTVEELQERGCKVTYTAAAHSVEDSRQAHLELGIPYDFPHLTDPEQWQRYLRGYLLADVLVCPSQHSAAVMRSFGRTGPIEIIPHGCDLPKCPTCCGSGDTAVRKYVATEVTINSGMEKCWKCGGSGIAPVALQPERFTVGYLGSYGPDKGVRYLLEAWKKLNYKDATLLLGGRDSQSPFVDALINHFGGGNIERVGWLDNVSEFYNRCSLYIQPSVTEGFGIEVLEAMAHGRPVLASNGAGASDVIPRTWRFASKDANNLAFKIDMFRKYVMPHMEYDSPKNWWRDEANKYSWDVIRGKYVAMWQNLLGGK